MINRLTCCTIAAILGLSGTSHACGPYGVDTSHLAKLAVHGDRPHADFAIERLRAMGSRGVAVLVEHHPEMAPGHRGWDAYCRAIDRVGAQRDNHAARLYWHTDLDRAKAVAAERGKPILSLRLLGRLDEDLSCANSRFFRTALYANEAISRELRDDFVLHWHSERPAPEITIDFGDGRRIVRTITGNSVHYVLDAEGRPIDALPGLHGPGAFQRWLQRTAVAARDMVNLGDDERDDRLARWHLAAMSRGGAFPTARDAAAVAITKSVVQAPILARTEVDLAAFAESRLDECRLDAGSRALMACKRQCGEGDMERMIVMFERRMAIDTVRNERLLHPQVHEWFANGEVTDLERLNTRIYTELFLTPADDPWLGLLPADAYAALDHDGVTVPE